MPQVRQSPSKQKVKTSKHHGKAKCDTAPSNSQGTTEGNHRCKSTKKAVRRKFRIKSQCSVPYLSYGFTSDLGSYNSMDPYEVMEKHVRVIEIDHAQALQNNMCFMNLRHTNRGASGGGDSSSVSQQTTAKRSETESDDTDPVVNVCDDEEDDVEDDESLTRAPNSDDNEVMVGKTPRREHIRTVQVSVMETIAKMIEPRELLDHLTVKGYFNYNYDNHALSLASGPGGSTAGKKDPLYTFLGLKTKKKFVDKLSSAVLNL